MRYLSICSGIESATVAWHPLGWHPAAFAEIDPFPCAVLHHHYGSGRPLRMPDPDEPGIARKEAKRRRAMIKGVSYLPENPTPNGVPNLGDFTQITRADLGSDIDLLVGGTPCQDFSIAGLRAGLDGDRGNLSLEFLRLAQRLRPRWLVWENVPGVLSSRGGRDFGAILGGMVELGYGLAYRVLDAQYVRTFGVPWAVPQRRRRVFVVGCLGDWRGAAAVLFDLESLSGNSPPRREAGQGAAVDVAPSLVSSGRGVTRIGESRGQDPVVAVVAGTLQSNGKAAGSATTQDAENGMLVAFGGNNQSGPVDVATACNAHGGPHGWLDFESETFIAFSSKDSAADAMMNVSPTLRAMNHDGSHSNAGGQIAVAHTLKGGGFDASEDGTGRGIPLVPIAFDTTQITSADNRCNPQPGDPCHPIPAHGHAPAIAMADPRGCAEGVGIRSAQETWRVRRLTPLECERLQGFPDGYTDVPYRRRNATPDGPRYKALGNSKASNCVEWLGRRIDDVDKIIRGRQAA
jgi:DNA (cytosine-5)-methyltransferase 1